MDGIALSNKKKMLKAMFISFLIMIFLIGRIAYIQFWDGNRLQFLAYEQQVQQRAINAKRGIIYDNTGKLIETIGQNNGKLAYTGNNVNVVLTTSVIAVIALAITVGGKKIANAK